MALRTPGRLAALLAAFLLGGGACATQGAGDGSGGNGGGEGADGGGTGGDDSAGPSPDAIVLGVDASTGGDATSSGGDATSGADAPDPPDAFDGAVVSKSCAGLPDGTVCGPSPDICHDAQLCAGGACAPAGPKADGFVCATAADDCHTNGTCKAGVCGAIGTRADGYEWTAGDDTARCCGGKAIHTDVDSDCGACGIKCNASNGESCSLLGGHYFCRGCVASAACWSGCCSESFTPYSCAASDCAGNCDSALCPTGSHCVSGTPGSSDYCAY
jgi:hypothetical protein